jgi:hypothetical protein
LNPIPLIPQKSHSSSVVAPLTVCKSKGHRIADHEQCQCERVRSEACMRSDVLHYGFGRHHRRHPSVRGVVCGRCVSNHSSARHQVLHSSGGDPSLPRILKVRGRVLYLSVFMSERQSIRVSNTKRRRPPRGHSSRRVLEVTFNPDCLPTAPKQTLHHRSVTTPVQRLIIWTEGPKPL